MRKSLDVRRHLPSAAFVIVMLAGIAALGAVFIYSGAYDIGADAPHTRLVYNLLHELRDRSIVEHARGVTPPSDLSSPKRILAGAGLYDEMCTGCHLAPGTQPSEMSQGLYPQAPRLAHGSDHTPAQQFWIIKHGVKLTAMPAWGKTHSDDLIWDLVGFLQQLPKLSPAQYEAAIASAPEDHDEMMEHMRGGHHPTEKGEH